MDKVILSIGDEPAGRGDDLAGPSAVLMAAWNALGVWMHEYPLTPDKDMKAFGENECRSRAGMTGKHARRRVCEVKNHSGSYDGPDKQARMEGRHGH
jgi:hypothetical protein